MLHSVTLNLEILIINGLDDVTYTQSVCVTYKFKQYRNYIFNIIEKSKKKGLSP
jgi:hypothetical protein